MVTGHKSFYQIERKEDTQMGGIQEPGPLGSGYNRSDHENQFGGYHHTLYDSRNNNHISWDTDQNGDYVDGTGHEDRDNQRVNDWPRDNYPRRDW